MSYDKFHPNAKNIYKVYPDTTQPSTELQGAISNAPIGPTAT
ncbi:MAG: hypothetical protein PHT92_07910 [Bacteroidales bacterium]|nr:hypothetical protein [Bacteroidales bacterium]